MKASARPAAAVAQTTSLKLWLPWKSAYRSRGNQHAANAMSKTPNNNSATHNTSTLSGSVAF